MGTLGDPTEKLIKLLGLNAGFSTDWLGKLGEIIELLQTPVPESIRWKGKFTFLKIEI